MTYQDFMNSANVEEYNTCNGWGFGGRYGMKYSLNGFEVIIAKYSTRHSGSFQDNSYCLPSGRAVSKVEFEKELSLLK